MKEVKYYISACSHHSESAAMCPMKGYSREDSIEILKEEGGVAYVLASEYEEMLAEMVLKCETLMLQAAADDTQHEYEIDLMRNNHETI